MAMDGSHYRDFAQYLKMHFPHFKVQKLSVHAGFTCPNRDGSKGRGGCTYCNNHSFSPSYTRFGSVSSQIEEGKNFFRHKYPEMKYLAYFQSYTNTYGDLTRLKDLYEEALSVPDVVGLIVGTRPDCVSPELLDYFQALGKTTFVYLEYGVESTHDETLLKINRGHTFAESVETIYATAERGIPIGVHMILGLPGEDMDDFRSHIRRLGQLPITSLKLHQLQILKGTQMAAEYMSSPEHFSLFSPEAYAEVICQLLRAMPRHLYIDRFVSQSPPEMLLAPKWGIKNYQFVQIVQRLMETNDWWQGDLYSE